MASKEEREQAKKPVKIEDLPQSTDASGDGKQVKGGMRPKGVQSDPDSGEEIY